MRTSGRVGWKRKLGGGLGGSRLVPALSRHDCGPHAGRKRTGRRGSLRGVAVCCRTAGPGGNRSGGPARRAGPRSVAGALPRGGARRREGRRSPDGPSREGPPRLGKYRDERARSGCRRAVKECSPVRVRLGRTGPAARSPCMAPWRSSDVVVAMSAVWPRASGHSGPRPRRAGRYGRRLRREKSRETRIPFLANTAETRREADSHRRRWDESLSRVRTRRGARVQRDWFATNSHRQANTGSPVEWQGSPLPILGWNAVQEEGEPVGVPSR